MDCRGVCGMPKLSQKKIITLTAKIYQFQSVEIEVNPSVRLTEIQKMVDDYAADLNQRFMGSTVEVTAEGLI